MVEMKINIKVYPDSGKQDIKKEGGNYKVYLKKRPEKGKANLELIKLLKKEFGKNVRIIKGKTSKRKMVELI